MCVDVRAGREGWGQRDQREDERGDAKKRRVFRGREESMCVCACECVRGVGGRHEAGRRGGGGGGGE